MRTDAREPANEQEIQTDLCIVGAGPAGISIARELDGTGVRVCLLESGGREVERRIQRLSRGESVGYPIHRLHHSRVRAFGGALRHPELGAEGWAARPLDPIDFDSRPGIPHTGWPFDRTHLDPFYGRAQAASGLGAYDYDPAVWSDRIRTPCIPLDGSELETTVFHFGEATFHHAYDQLARSMNVELFLHARVTDLASDHPSGCVKRVEVRRDDGSRLVIRPRAVVLAAGGIENARLLLLADGQAGLGNRHDLVGRFFAERLSARTGHVVTTRPELVDETGFYSIHRVRRSLICGALRVADKVQRDRQLLNCAFFVLPRPAPITTEAVRSLATLGKAVNRRPRLERVRSHLGNIVTGGGDLGALALSRARSTKRVLIVRAQGEQAPNPESRVTLGSRRDDMGLPVARVAWRPIDSDRASIRSSQQVIDAALRASNFGNIERMLGDEQPPTLFEGNHHHLGTTRMHASPRQGVVDPDCRVNGVPNLYVAGSSVFPTYGSSNPTLTVVALALRLADHLSAQLAQS